MREGRRLWYRGRLITAGEHKRKWWGLVRRRECLVPTWRGWLALLLLLAALTCIGLRETYPFLAVNQLQPGGILVIEGWAPDYGFKEAMDEFQRHHYDKLYVTGGPVDSGSLLTPYKTFAEVGAAILLKLGMSTKDVQAVPAPGVRQDRTWASAASLGRWLREHQANPRQVQLITEGPHARRSRLLFQKALGPGVTVGVTALPVRDFEERWWWCSSAGFRNVTGELLAYFYARLLFREPSG